MSIQLKPLQTAIDEARRFIEAAEVAKRMAGSHPGMTSPWLNGGQYCAAVKRASMDLSRALAGVRRGGG